MVICGRPAAGEILRFGAAPQNVNLTAQFDLERAHEV
jgi:hypothetical protein